MDNEFLIKQLLEEFKKEVPMQDSLSKDIALRHLLEGMLDLINQAEHAVVQFKMNVVVIVQFAKIVFINKYGI
ncbi:MAG: hypothetical protein KGI58_04050 [Patescibacteria group bacterium]|nr:hypothetical protein [Patescibacteria group bacterium]